MPRLAAFRLPGRIRIVADAVQAILRVLDAHPTTEWERALRQAFGGRSVYISAATGRAQVRELIALGVAARTSRRKVYGK